MTGTFSSPSQGDICKPADLVGHLLIVRPVEFQAEFQTANGPSDMIRLDVADLSVNDERGQWGVVYRDAMWFSRGLVPGLRRQIGELVLARMAQGLAKPGQNAAWILNDAVGDAQAVTAGQQWLTMHPEFSEGRGQATTAAPAPPVQPSPPPPIPFPPTAPVSLPFGPPAATPAPPTQGVTVPPLATATSGAPGVAVTVPPGGNPFDQLSAEQRQALAALGFTVPGQ